MYSHNIWRWVVTCSLNDYNSVRVPWWVLDVQVTTNFLCIWRDSTCTLQPIMWHRPMRARGRGYQLWHWRMQKGTTVSNSCRQHYFHSSVSTQYSTTLYCRPRASKLLTTTYPRENGYEWTCSSLTAKRKGHCLTLRSAGVYLDGRWIYCLNGYSSVWWTWYIVLP